MKNTAGKLESIIKSENINPEEAKNMPLLIEEISQGYANGPTLMKRAVSLYLTSRNC